MTGFRVWHRGQVRVATEPSVGTSLDIGVASPDTAEVPASPSSRSAPNAFGSTRPVTGIRAPHVPQKASPGWLSVPQLGQTRRSLMRRTGAPRRRARAWRTGSRRSQPMVHKGRRSSTRSVVAPSRPAERRTSLVTQGRCWAVRCAPVHSLWYGCERYRGTPPGPKAATPLRRRGPRRRYLPRLGGPHPPRSTGILPPDPGMGGEGGGWSPSFDRIRDCAPATQRATLDDIWADFVGRGQGSVDEPRSPRPAGPVAARAERSVAGCSSRGDLVEVYVDGGRPLTHRLRSRAPGPWGLRGGRRAGGSSRGPTRWRDRPAATQVVARSPRCSMAKWERSRASMLEEASARSSSARCSMAKCSPR